MTNDDTPSNNQIKIPLSKRNGERLEALISLEDAPLQLYTWSSVGTKHVYPVRSMKGNNRQKIYLGREVLAAKLKDEEKRALRDDERVHYRDGNRLNCKRENLEPKASNRRYSPKL